MPSPEQPERLAYTVKQFSSAANVSTRTTYNLIACGELPAIRVGGRIRGKLLIPKQSADNFLKKRYHPISAESSPKRKQAVA